MVFNFFPLFVFVLWELWNIWKYLVLELFFFGIFGKICICKYSRTIFENQYYLFGNAAQTNVKACLSPHGAAQDNKDMVHCKFCTIHSNTHSIVHNHTLYLILHIILSLSSMHYLLQILSILTNIQESFFLFPDNQLFQLHFEETNPPLLLDLP